MTFPTSLRARVLALCLASLIAVAIPATAAFFWIVNSSVVKIGTLFAEKQILFDRYRGLESLMREVSLAETVARAPSILQWAEDEASPDKMTRGIAELEHYRLSFKDQSYFFVIDRSGSYYFNDDKDSYAGNQKRYTLSAGNPRDGWYYKTIAAGSGCQLNVDRDDNLAVTKVWINCVIQKDGRVLGVIGTGVDLSQFIREVVEFPQKGVQSMFVDRNGAVQAHRDPKLVDFHSLTKDVKAKKTIFRLLDEQADKDRLVAMMKEVSAGPVLVRSEFMRIGGHKYLVGVGYLDRLGWFNVTLMDVDEIVDRRLFLPTGLLLAAMLVLAAALMTLLFKRSVLDRLARLERGVHRIQAGDLAVPAADDGKDEIGRLSRAFRDMAKSVSDNTAQLESMVQERTEKLERLAYLDPLTEISNRRGFIEGFEHEKNRARRAGKTFGLLLVDMDHLKKVNDTFGHQIGDGVIVEVARRISGTLRNYDICARWGGDEFIVLVGNCDTASLTGIAEKVLAAAGSSMPLSDGKAVKISVSIGAAMVDGEDALGLAVAKADAALYAAKQSGRNSFVIYDPARHGDGGATLQLIAERP